jgi:hypothetical protein
MTMTAILLNAISIAFETSREIKEHNAHIFQSCDLGFVTYYTIELALKVFAKPREFWASSYNLVRNESSCVCTHTRMPRNTNSPALQFDVFILATSYIEVVQLLFGLSMENVGSITFLRVLRTLRALRALRSISFIRSLQVLVDALAGTLSEVMNLLALLLLWMYIFAIMGFYFFGYHDENSGNTAPVSAHFSSLASGFMTLFVFVTADGWTDVQADMDAQGLGSSKIFSVCFLFVGHFIFMNIFIGVVIQNIEQAAYEDKMLMEREKASSFTAKKQKTCPGRPEHLSGLRIFHRKSKSVFYGAFGWARGALNGPNQWFPARSVAEQGLALNSAKETESAADNGDIASALEAHAQVISHGRHSLVPPVCLD